MRILSFVAVATLALTTPLHAQRMIDAPMASYSEMQPLSPLMSAPDLQLRLGTGEDIQVVDIRNADAMRSLYSYADGHIPGAINYSYGQWRAIWSDPLSVPSDAEMTAILRQTGLTTGRPVVIVHSSASNGNFGSAAWVYWVLKSAGYPQIAILDGGIRAWERAGGEMSVEATVAQPSTETFALDQTWLATHEDVDQIIAGTSDAILLDARPMHDAARDGLLGAINLSGAGLLAGDHGEVGDEMDLFMRVKEAAGVDWYGADIVTYCDNGALAAIDWFMASEVAGIPNVRIYGHSLDARRKALAN